jgi:hypothetical protein
VHRFVGSTQFGEHSVERCNPRVEFPKFEHQIAYQLLHTGLKPLAFVSSIRNHRSSFVRPLRLTRAAHEKNSPKLIDERGSLVDESISRPVVTKRIVGRVAVSAYASASRSSDVTLMTEDASQRQRAPRKVFSGLRYVIRYGIAWRAICRPGLLGVSGRNDGRSPRNFGSFCG